MNKRDLMHRSSPSQVSLASGSAVVPAPPCPPHPHPHLKRSADPTVWDGEGGEADVCITFVAKVQRETSAGAADTCERHVEHRRELAVPEGTMKGFRLGLGGGGAGGGKKSRKPSERGASQPDKRPGQQIQPLAQTHQEGFSLRSEDKY